VQARRKDQSVESAAKKAPRVTNPHLALKSTPPKLSSTSLHRERLAMASPELNQKTVIVVEAPAGFGKTSLMTQWRREALQNGAVAAWLSLDSSDEGGRLLQGLAMSMRLASGRKEVFRDQLYTPAHREDELEALTGWMAEVANLAVDTVLMLDDCHALPQPTLENELNYLLHNAPPNLTVILASRRPIGLALADLLAHGRYARIDCEALRFTQQESIALLDARFGPRIDTDSSVSLHELTEGWPLGLQLAVSTIERSKDLHSAIAGFSVQSGDIQRYFVECLVDGLAPKLAEFLREVSFVDTLHPELCAAITEREDSAGLLALLRDETPIFLQAAGSDWLRFHPLAREFLMDRFMALPAGRRKDFHARAAQWLEQHELYEEAARQALRAGQQEHAYELMARCLYEIVLTGQVSRIQGWIERMPAAEIERRPALRLAVGWIFANSERHAETAGLIEPLMNDNEADEGVRYESAAICACAAFFMDDIDSVERYFSPWVDSNSSGSALQQVVGTNVGSVLALYGGAPEQARYALQQLPESVLRDGGAYPRGWVDWIVAYSYLWEGHAILAEEVLRSSLDRAESESGRRGPVAVMLASALASILWDRDQSNEAAALLANRLDVLVRRTAPDAIAMGYIAAARLATAEGLEPRAWDLLEYLYAVGESRNLPRLCVASLGEQIRMHSLRSHREACSDLAVRLQTLLDETPNCPGKILLPLLRLQIGVTHAYLAAVEEDWQGVLEALEPAGPIALKLRRGQDSLRINLLTALALKRTGRNGEELLRESVEMAESLGQERILADTHPDLVDWVRLLGVQRPEAVTHATASYSQATAWPKSRPAQVHVNPSALLTPKECEVLQLLAGSMSNKQIAQAMGISDETVKWHLKNLFGKLHAGTRKHLVDRARMLGILDLAS
jgi:LuxR family maltose regulon positive regulatory protein